MMTVIVHENGRSSKHLESMLGFADTREVDRLAIR